MNQQLNVKLLSIVHRVATTLALVFALAGVAAYAAIAIPEIAAAGFASSAVSDSCPPVLPHTQPDRSPLPR